MSLGLRHCTSVLLYDYIYKATLPKANVSTAISSSCLRLLCMVTYVWRQGRTFCVIRSLRFVSYCICVILSQEGVPYQMTSSMLSQGACLDNNHTHFILVDDGTVNRYGGEISFRASLENCISQKQMEKSCGKKN